MPRRPRRSLHPETPAPTRSTSARSLPPPRRYRVPLPVTLPVLLTAALVVTAAAQTATVRVRDGSVGFAYRVTLIPVNGTVNAVQSSDTTLDFAALRRTRTTVTVNLAALKTGIALRDEHAREALDARNFPNASFTLENFSGPERLPDGQAVQGDVTGTFTLRGVPRPLKAPVTLTRRGNSLNVKATFTVNPQAHGVNVKGGDTSTRVTVNLTLAP
ncbi:YceI family protein [Deinococcus sp. 14RED07]|uniref:YceI family protein n=1 Tax=Deinococcus sp. 14RED07 TaxID=2745874 RepID=UPI001E3F8F48|nr:YceI family protein [Deinococcus sp. 14RED07]MCD0174684.1 YceI family protein [Deinococcus sp. 14RED07]